MCRWIAYAGPAIPMSLALVEPKHSLLVQSQNAVEGAEPTNGDGFGVGWYSSHLGTPGMFKDVRPAWNDENFIDLTRHVRSHLFMAHVRAATGTAIQRSNCHPFRYGKWMFQHNGLIPQFHQIRRDLVLRVAPELFNAISGTTDSELLFHLALTEGLDQDPRHALSRTVGIVQEMLSERQIEGELHFSAALSDGESLFAVRYASQGTPRTLYFATELDVLHTVYPEVTAIPEGSVIVVSEPLGPVLHWESVPPGTLLEAGRGTVRLENFQPI
jgi:glutamine amidotransferase